MAVLRSALDAILSIDGDGRIVEFNPAAERMFGYRRADVLGEEMAELVIPPRQREAHRSGMARLLAGEGARIFDRRIELEAMRADGTQFPVELTITQMPGAPPLYTGFIRDITDRRLVEQERAERLGRQALVVALGQSALAGTGLSDLTAEALSTLVEGLGVQRGAALTTDDNGGLRRVSAVGVGPLAGHGELVGEAQAALLERTRAAGGALRLSGAEMRELHAALPLTEEMGCLLSVTLMGDRGAVFGLLAVAAASPDALRPEDEGFAQAIANVVGTATARWRADEEIARLGLHDPLTGLPNRPLFEDRLEQELDRARRDEGEAAVLLVDLDGFRTLNDSFGHRTGDDALVAAGARLKALVPLTATVGRLAGDRFGVLLPDVHGEGPALGLAAQVGEALGEPLLVGGRELSITASIGIAFAESGATVGEVIGTAAAAASRAKERGGGRTELATPAMRRRLIRAAEVEQGLRRALTADELCLHFQPIIDLDSGDTVALEALVRWQHPDHGLLAPAQFLPAAEATGLAVPLGAEILAIACRQLARWCAELGPERAPAVHVNVSARHFAAPGLAETVARALRRTGAPPELLVLEVSETLVTRDGQAAGAQLDDLRALGVRILLDRFGSGHSSLAAIRRLPFDAMKVDASFLPELAETPRDLRLVEAMIGMGHSLGLRVGASKVETREQLRLLRTLGLDRAQGELFAAPLSAEAALALLREPSAWTDLLETTRPPAAEAAPEAPPAAAEDAAPAAGAGATLSLGQAAHALGISTTTARRWADDGRLPSTRTVGGHRRFAVAEVRRLLAERGRPALAPTEAPKRALPTLAALVEAHGATLSEMSWRGLYGDLRSGFFTDPAGAEAAGLWTAALASAAGTGNYEMLHEATTALMRRAEQAGTSVLERHVAVERFAELLVRTLGRRACPREEIVEVRRLFVSLAHGQLAAVG